MLLLKKYALFTENELQFTQSCKDRVWILKAVVSAVTL